MADPFKGIILRGSGVTNVGKVRSHNEDNIHLWTSDNGLMLAIVADGMGGAAAGEEASRIAVETIMSKLALPDPDEAPEPTEIDIEESQLSSAVKAANLSILEEAVEHPTQRGMGTTLTMVFIRGRMAKFAHVGDSRAYHVYGNGEIQQITSDHSFVQALLKAGHITEDQAETHPMSNVLYRALGQTRDVDVDTYTTMLNVGDKLILCSDGLTRHVRATEIGQIAASTNNPNIISSKLVSMANERGGEDNISVIVVVLEGDDGTDIAMSINREDEDTIVLNERNARRSIKRDRPGTHDARASYEPEQEGRRESDDRPRQTHARLNARTISQINSRPQGHDLSSRF